MCKLNKLFPPQVALWSWCFIVAVETLREHCSEIKTLQSKSPSSIVLLLVREVFSLVGNEPIDFGLTVPILILVTISQPMKFSECLLWEVLVPDTVATSSVMSSERGCQ